MVVLYDYITLHSGRLNDGTTRNVRRKLRNHLQDALSQVDECYDLERSVGIESRVRRDLVPSGL